eukprot:7418196-Pyramimonas_sp.AAC.1
MRRLGDMHSSWVQTLEQAIVQHHQVSFPGAVPRSQGPSSIVPEAKASARVREQPLHDQFASWWGRLAT